MIKKAEDRAVRRFRQQSCRKVKDNAYQHKGNDHADNTDAMVAMAWETYSPKLEPQIADSPDYYYFL